MRTRPGRSILGVRFPIKCHVLAKTNLPKPTCQNQAAKTNLKDLTDMKFTMNPDGTMPPSPAGPTPEVAAPGATFGDGGTAPGDVVRESDTANFVVDVIEASKSVPVIVDFWAPWCGPCKTLGPMLEKLVRLQGGLVRMVKVNVDENQALAQQLQIQSIPTVYAFKDGRPVDAFAGALPESQLKTFIDKLLGDAKAPLAAAMDEAEALLAGGDATGAMAIYAEVLSADEENPAAIGGLIRCYIAAGEPEHARAVFDGLTPAMQNKPEITQAMSALALAEEIEDVGDITELKVKIETNENDHQARFDLGLAYYARGQNEEAVDALIDLVRRNRKWNDEAARKQLVKIFDALGNADPVTQDGRRKLSSVLFA